MDIVAMVGLVRKIADEGLIDGRCDEMVGRWKEEVGVREKEGKPHHQAENPWWEHRQVSAEGLQFFKHVIKLFFIFYIFVCLIEFRDISLRAFFYEKS